MRANPRPARAPLRRRDALAVARTHQQDDEGYASAPVRFHASTGPPPKGHAQRYSVDTIWCAVYTEAVSTVVHGDFEWDHRKAKENLTKHGISLEEGATVFADPAVVFVDDGSGTGRFAAIGMSVRARVLCVVHVERGDRDRIISARRASSAEETLYVQGG